MKSNNFSQMNRRVAACLLIATVAASVFAAEEEGHGWAMGPFVKHGKPLLKPNPEATFDCPVSGKTVRWEAQNVYNPAAVVRDGKVYLLYRADDTPREKGWGRTCRIGLVSSNDGINFKRNPEPVIYPDNDQWKKHEWEGGCEDIHIIEDEAGKYYVNYTAWNGKGSALCVATSDDLKNWTKHGPAFADAHQGRFVANSRSGVVVSRREGERLVAAKINGKYWMYWRIGCYMATSDDLIHWTPIVDDEGKLISAIKPRAGRFDSGCVEAGAVALLRDDGILFMFNAINRGSGGGDADYPGGWSVMGQALFDAKDPARLLKRADKPLLHAEHEWELKGFCSPAVVSNTMVFFRGKWHLYYGAADRRIAVAVFDPKSKPQEDK